MIDTNTEEIGEYLFLATSYSICAWIIYDALLFSPIIPLSYINSKVVLAVLHLLSVINLIINIKSKRNALTTASSILIPYGVYSLLSYGYVFPKLYMLSGFVLLVSFLSISIVSGKKEKQHKHRRKTQMQKFLRFWRRIVIAFALFSVFTMLCILCIKGVQRGILVPQQKSEIVSDNEAATINNNLDRLISLLPEKWNELDLQERINICQTVIAIECNYLGIPNNLHIVATTLSDSLSGSYDPETQTIKINLSHLQTSPPDEVLNTLLHESYHAYQQILVGFYNTLTDDEKSLFVFRHAELYAKEFDSYTSSKTDPLEYAYQQCEIDAQEYAADGVDEYYCRIFDYVM